MPAQRRLKQEFADLLDSDEARWNAVLHRDARLDGLLYYGVSSTGIYCRPVFRARRAENEHGVLFRPPHDSPEAGFSRPIPFLPPPPPPPPHPPHLLTPP